eukprot:gnl/TRDRNA2_/TRDRNA2_94599_c0_seq1.p1 gnl/TRDRNA2_/TRDRNA2_94599_c0~~gnl/TRDRNA2_/TRDRNA2_94599_c0_seq1.p1  ORF type:complete len:421 (+),score=112.99 gnl/TRDRNA2_/TRDRNA2_94599_c0_seq1:98-1264(+)
MTRLLLRCPELMPDGSWEEDAAASNALASDDEDDEDDVDDEQDVAMDGSAPAPEPKVAEKATDKSELTPIPAPETGKQAEDMEGDGAKEALDVETADNDKNKKEEGAEKQVKETEQENDAEQQAKDAEEDEKRRDEEEDNAELERPEGTHCVGPSLFETVQSSTPSGAAADLRSEPALTLADRSSPEDILRRSRVRWFSVRLSHRARFFLSQVPKHFVRLASIFRYFCALAESLPVDFLVLLLEPILSPTYRCTSALANTGGGSNLPDVRSLEEAIQLDHGQQVEFLVQLAQTCIDTLNSKMQEAGRSSDFSRSLTKVRKAVEVKRSARAQQKRMQFVTDPEAAAKRKRARNKQKQVTKKRKTREIIVAKKGGRGGTGVKKETLRTLL